MTGPTGRSVGGGRLLRIATALAIVIMSVVFTSTAGWAKTAIPVKPSAWVLDNAHALTAETVTTVERDLEDYNRRTGNQLSVLLVSTTGNQSIEDFAHDVVSKWGIGEKGKDNGVLMVLAMKDRKGRIEVGYGLEGTLTDIEARKVLDDQVFPRLKASDPNEAVRAGEVAIRSELGDPQATAPPPAPESSPGGGGSGAALFGLVPVVFGLLIAGSMFRARRGGGWGGGSWSAGPGIFYGSGGGWGSSGGDFGSRGGGFGGFGGGSSGGGGASGSW